MSVPADYAHPERGTFSLALIRRRDLDTAHRIGTLVFNPGGPLSGVAFLPAFVHVVDNSIADRFDLLSWDPRGVGASGPIHCWSDQEKDRFFSLLAPPLGDTRAATLLDATAQQLAAECGRRYGNRLSLYGTANSARDLDRIRAAVGDAKLTYLGSSWGTRLGAAYADLFVTEIGVFPKLDSQYDEIYDEITLAISDLVKDQPHAYDFLRGRTFARSLH